MLRMMLMVTLAGLFAAGCNDGDGASGGGEPTSTTRPSGVVPPPDRASDISGPASQVRGFTPTADGCQTYGPDGESERTCLTISTLRGKFIADGTGTYGAASVTVHKATPILRAGPSGTWTPASFDELAEGDEVRVWFTGPVAESYPVQAEALVVVLT